MEMSGMRRTFCRDDDGRQAADSAAGRQSQPVAFALASDRVDRRSGSFVVQVLRAYTSAGRAVRTATQPAYPHIAPPACDPRVKPEDDGAVETSACVHR